MSAGGVCDAAVTARTRYGWVKFRKCGQFLDGKIFLTLKKSVYKTYVRPAILYDS